MYDHSYHRASYNCRRRRQKKRDKKNKIKDLFQNNKYHFLYDFRKTLLQQLRWVLKPWKNEEKKVKC